MGRNPTPRMLIAALAAALSLALAVGALAARPTPGKAYTGFTSVTWHGFKATVRFNVSSSGKQLLAFKYYNGNCQGMGGPGNPFINNPYLSTTVGTIPVSSTGTFSVANAKWTSSSADAPTKTTTSTVNGRFTTAKTATGTIHYTQKTSSGPTGTCGGTLTFTAKTP
jgi:hypothetical protein